MAIPTDILLGLFILRVAWSALSDWSSVHPCILFGQPIVLYPEWQPVSHDDDYRCIHDIVLSAGRPRGSHLFLSISQPFFVVRFNKLRPFVPSASHRLDRSGLSPSIGRGTTLAIISSSLLFPIFVLLLD